MDMKTKLKPLTQRLLFQNYIRLFGGSLLLSALGVLSFILVIDPYGLFQLIDLPGLNTSKPRMYRNARMVKAHYVTNAKPHGLIMGSSRADLGLNAGVAEKIGISNPVFNSSLPSARIREVYAYLRHAHGEGGLHQVVIGLDFFMFDPNVPYEPGFEKGRLALNSNGSVWLQLTKDYLRAFFSYDALEAAIYTLRHQGEYAVSYLENGSQDPRSRQLKLNEKGGHRTAFKAALRETVTSRDGIAALHYAPSSLEQNEELTVFYEMLRFCQDEGIHLYLAISPSHALWLQAIWELGVWPDYERWKRDLNNVVEQVRAEAAGNAALELWDFSGFSEIHKEEPPAEGNQDAVMRWYWEASHYKHETGNLVLFRLMNTPTIGIPKGFGIRLSHENINQHLRLLNKDRELYFQEHPEAVRLLWEVLHDVRGLIKDD